MMLVVQDGDGKVVERFGSEGTFAGHLQGHLQLDQVQPDLEYFQEWSIYHLSGQERCGLALGVTACTPLP